jgi:hypothetical protein
MFFTSDMLLLWSSVLCVAETPGMRKRLSIDRARARIDVRRDMNPPLSAGKNWLGVYPNCDPND